MGAVQAVEEQAYSHPIGDLGQAVGIGGEAKRVAAQPRGGQRQVDQGRGHGEVLVPEDDPPQGVDGQEQDRGRHHGEQVPDPVVRKVGEPGQEVDQGMGEAPVGVAHRHPQVIVVGGGEEPGGDPPGQARRPHLVHAVRAQGQGRSRPQSEEGGPDQDRHEEGHPLGIRPAHLARFPAGGAPEPSPVSREQEEHEADQERDARHQDRNPLGGQHPGGAQDEKDVSQGHGAGRLKGQASGETGMRLCEKIPQPYPRNPERPHRQHESRGGRARGVMGKEQEALAEGGQERERPEPGNAL